MKKFVIVERIMCLGLLMCACAFLTACGDDDDGSYEVSATIIETEDGDKLQVTRVGNVYYGYDDDGYINYLKWDGEEYEVSDNATKFYLDDDDDEETIQFTYNGSGYISKVTAKGIYYYDEDDGDYDSWEESASLSYDGSGHLTKISYSGKETEIYDDEEYWETWSGSITLTWSDGLLTQSVWTEECVENDGNEGGDIETYVFDYNDEQYPNAYNQYTPSCCVDYDMIFFVMAYAGLTGKGPDYLPRTVAETYYYWDDHEGEGDYESSTTYKYGFNSDGTIDYQCTSSGKSYKYFEYGDADSYSLSKALSLNIEEEETSSEKQRRHGLFRKSSKRQHNGVAIEE